MDENLIAEIKRNLRGFDLSLLEEIKFLRLRHTIGHYGVCDSPDVRPWNRSDSNNGYNVRCAINTETCFPYEISMDVAQNRLGELGQADTVEYDISVTFDNVLELSIWLAGRTLFKFIALTNNLIVSPEICHANAYGLGWLISFRNQPSQDGKKLSERQGIPLD